LVIGPNASNSQYNLVIDDIIGSANVGIKEVSVHVCSVQLHTFQQTCTCRRCSFMAMLIKRKGELPPFRVYQDSLGAQSRIPRGELAYDGHDDSEDDTNQLLIHVWAASEVSQALARATRTRARGQAVDISALRTALGGHMRAEPMLVLTRWCPGGGPLDIPSCLLQAAEVQQMFDDKHEPVAACPPGNSVDRDHRVPTPAGLARSLVIFAASQPRRGR
jgi:hypothetical protein